MMIDKVVCRDSCQIPRGPSAVGAWLRLGGGVFVAEEGLIEGVDPGVQGAQFLADFGHVLASLFVAAVNVLADGGDVLALDTKLE